MDVLSEVQLKAINIKDGPAMIIAGPGSGKTKRSQQDNQIRPHDAMGLRPPVPETLLKKIKITATDK